MKDLQIKRRFKNYLPNLVSDILKLICVIIFVFPFYWMISSSFKTRIEVNSFPPQFIPGNPFNLDNYRIAFNLGKLTQGLRNNHPALCVGSNLNRSSVKGVLNSHGEVCGKCKNLLAHCVELFA